MAMVPAAEVQFHSLTGAGSERVRVEAFCIDRLEVSTKDFSQWLSKEQSNQDSSDRTSLPRECREGRQQRGNLPARCVTLVQAQAFCAARSLNVDSLIEQQPMRVPIEHEWMLAAGGVRTSSYPWGEQRPSARYVNARDRGCNARGARAPMFAASDRFARTAPVDQFLSGASPYGVLQMAGNVAEWTVTRDDLSHWVVGQYVDADRFREYLSQQRERAVHGGSWRDTDPAHLRVDHQQMAAANALDPTIGFRCVWVLPSGDDGGYE
jgi:formylglycine-generating enzyme required for sulfatase activity